jgi:SPP1 gp7 family putative phage head morphogenesis protein
MPSLVVDVMTAHKAALLAGEQEQMRAMAQRWRQVENSLTDQVELFVRRVQQDGLTASQIRSRQFQLDRYQSLLAQVRTQLDAYTDYAAPLITAQQRNHAQLGIRHASQAITAVGVDNGITISFETLPTSAVENMAGLAGDGSPLRDLLRDSYGSAADGMLNELARATALGQNPVVTASRMIRNGLSQSLTRMLTVARTETLRVYRESSRRTYLHSNVVSRYKRLATRDLRVCMACLMDDGHIYEANEVMPTHPNCRCAMVPIVDGYKAAAWQQGPDWFTAQSDANQRQLLGAGRYDAWKDGLFDLAQLVTVKTDDVWGDSLQVTPLRDL